MAQKLLLIGICGALGTLARYGVSSLVTKHWGQGFPWGTVVVNAAGCFLFGLVCHSLASTEEGSERAGGH